LWISFESKLFRQCTPYTTLFFHHIHEPPIAMPGKIYANEGNVRWECTTTQSFSAALEADPGVHRVFFRAYPALIAAKFTGAALELAKVEAGSAPAELKAKFPLGKLPALVDGDVTLFESNAIAYYGAHRTHWTSWTDAIPGLLPVGRLQDLMINESAKTVIPGLGTADADTI